MMRLLVLSALLGLAIAGLPTQKPGPKDGHHPAQLPSNMAKPVHPIASQHKAPGDHVEHHKDDHHDDHKDDHHDDHKDDHHDDHKDDHHDDHKDDHHDDDDDKKGRRGPGLGRLREASDPRFALNAIRIFKTEKLLHKLQEKIHHADKVDPDRFVRELRARVAHLEAHDDDQDEDECDKTHFQCGGNAQECINDLLVCDGHEDCHNGHDEADTVCTTGEVHPGSVFHGWVHWTGCVIREDHQVTLTITGAIRPKAYTSRLLVKAHLSAETSDHHKLDYELVGYYNYAHRRLVFKAKDDEHDSHHAALGAICKFNRGDDIRLDCNLVTRASLQKCAEIHYTRDDKDAEDHIDEDDE